MSGKSIHTQMEHARVFALYEAKLKEHGKMARTISRQAFYQEIADETGYSFISVRVIIGRFTKKQTLDYRAKHRAQ